MRKHVIGINQHYLLILLILLMMLLSQACAKTVVETKIHYVLPEIPAVLLSPCDEVKYSITTNCELLMSYISLQTAYLTCSSKVLSISMILKSYANIYE